VVLEGDEGQGAMDVPLCEYVIRYMGQRMFLELRVMDRFGIGTRFWEFMGITR
jgi:hypothetical protein